MNRRQVLMGLGAGGLLGVNAVTLWMASHRRQKKLPVQLNGQPMLVSAPPNRDVEAIAFGKRSAKGQLESVTADGTLAIWDSVTNRVLSTSSSPNQSGAKSICFSECGKWLAAIGRDHHLWVWERQNPENDYVLPLEGRPVSLVSCMPYVGSYEGIVPNHLHSEGLLNNRYAFFEIPVFAVSLEDGRILYFQGPDPLVQGQSAFSKVAELENWQLGPQSMVSSDDGRWMAGVSENKIVTIINAPGKTTFLRIAETESKIRCIGFLPNTSKLALGLENGVVDVWDVTRNMKVESLKNNTEPVASLVLTNDAVVVATDSGRVIGQPLKSGGKVREFGKNPGRNQSLAVNDDRSVLASAWGADVKFWSV